MTNTSGAPVTVFMFGMRTRFPAQGFEGGRPGAPRRFEVNGQAVQGKGRLVLEPGDTLTVYEAGGGGYGDPKNRDPASVLADVEDGAVSVEGALRDYGVHVDLQHHTASR